MEKVVSGFNVLNDAEYSETSKKLICVIYKQNLINGQKLFQKNCAPSKKKVGGQKTSQVTFIGYVKPYFIFERHRKLFSLCTT